MTGAPSRVSWAASVTHQRNTVQAPAVNSVACASKVTWGGADGPCDGTAVDVGVAVGVAVAVAVTVAVGVAVAKAGQTSANVSSGGATPEVKFPAPHDQPSSAPSFTWKLLAPLEA